MQKWLFLSAAFVAIGVRLIAFTAPVVDWDEYAFALVGRDVLAGKLPFSGVFDIKPSGLYYLFAFSQSIFGDNLFSIRVLGLAAASTSAYLILRLIEYPDAPTSDHRLLALGFASTYLVLSLVNGGVASLSELLASPFLFFGFYLTKQHARGQLEDYRFGVMLGITLGIGCQITYLLFPVSALLCGGWCVMHYLRGKSAPRSMAFAFVLLASFLAAFCLVLAPQWVSGDLPNYFAMQAGFLAGYQPLESRVSAFLRSLGRIAKIGLPLAIIATGIVLEVVNRRMRPAIGVFTESTSTLAFALVLALAGGVVSSFASGRFYPHYFILILVPALALLAVLAVDVDTRRFRTYVAIACSAACIIAVREAMVGWPWLISGRQLTFEERAAAAVAAASSPEDLILVFNESHSIYFLSRRPSAAKFVFPTHYLEATNFRVLGIEPSRYFESLLQRKPKVLVIGELLNNKSGPRPDYALIDKDYLAKATIFEGKRRAEIYERRTDVSDAPDSRLIPR